MENAYGIGITNRYALFIDEDEEGRDPIDILKQAEEVGGDKKQPKKAELAKTNPKAVKKDTNKENGKSLSLSLFMCG